MELRAYIPPLKSAIIVGGGEGDCYTIKLDVNPKNDTEVSQLMTLRGKELKVTLEEKY